MTAIERQSLDQALPPDVASGAGRLFAYHRFPVFSWPWFAQRNLLAWPLAVLGGAAFSLWHAASMGTAPEFFALAWRASLSYLVVVTAGPLLAVGARRLPLPAPAERALVVFSLLVGLAIADAAVSYSLAFHTSLMRRHSGPMPMPAPMRSLGQTVSDLLGVAPQLIALFIGGGGYELPAYLSEPRRLAEYKRRRDLAALEEQKSAADARLAVLQAQIEPHFLFNTLASVRSLIRSEPERAAATIDALSDYLRAALPKFRAGPEAATLGEQLDLCERYLELMQVRMGGRMAIAVEAAPELRVLPFPPLILIPLVENAVKHGIEPKAGPGRIAIRARLTEKPSGAALRGERTLEVAVEDDGVGLCETMGLHGGVGLANVRAQLAARFGPGAYLEVSSRTAGGARALINLPAAAT